MAQSSSSSSSSPFQSLTKWLSLKLYQVEVTFSVYIFTPLEKFIFCTFPHLAWAPFPDIRHITVPALPVPLRYLDGLSMNPSLPLSISCPTR